MMALASLVGTASAAMTSLSAAVCRTFPEVGTQVVRYASKKAGGATRNKIGRAKRKHRGIKVVHGAFVHKGDILVKQFGLKYYPGENVIMDDSWSLKAAHDGIVVISTEQLNPYPDSPLFMPIQNGLVMNKQFFSVIPTPLHDDTLNLLWSYRGSHVVLSGTTQDLTGTTGVTQ